jgi:hypothetical protein
LAPPGAFFFWADYSSGAMDGNTVAAPVAAAGVDEVVGGNGRVRM